MAIPSRGLDCDSQHNAIFSLFLFQQIRIASPELFEELVEETGAEGMSDNKRIETILDNIPTEWSANVLS